MPLFNRGVPKLSPEILALRSIPMFSRLTPQEFRIIAQIAHERRYLPGEFIFEEGDEGLGMYAVLEGSVRIHRPGRDGANREIALVKAGGYFGELALLDGFPRSASATAVEATRLLFFFRPEFLDILETHGRLGAKLSLEIARHTAQRLRQSVAECQEA